MDITKMSDIELESVGYKTVKDIQRLNTNLQMIESELSRRAKELSAKTPTPHEPATTDK